VETNIIHVILLLATGFIVGGMNAIAGGGMLIGFPVLIVLGVPALYANATANVASLPGQLASAFGYRQYIRRVPKRYALLLLPIVVGATGGALTLRHTSAGRFADLIPLLLLFGVGLFIIQPLLHFHLHRHVTGASRDWLPMVLLGVAAIPLSFYGGYFGAGYGFMMLAFLGFTNMSDTHMMNGMKNVAATFVAAASIACLASSHFIHWRVGIIMAIGSLIGGYVGARNAQRLSNRYMRVAIICVGLAAVFLLALRTY
jgi:hypothetical protein